MSRELLCCFKRLFLFPEWKFKWDRKPVLLAVRSIKITAVWAVTLYSLVVSDDTGAFSFRITQ